MISGDYSPNDKVDLGKIDEGLAQRILDTVGIDVKGYTVAVEARQINHILLDHGESGSSDHSMADPRDIAKMEFALRDPDEISAGGRTSAYVTRDGSKNRPASTVLYEKYMDGRSYYVIEALPQTKKKTLYIVTAFISKSGYKNRASQSTNAHSPDATPEAKSVNALKERVPHTEDKVKRQFSLSGADQADTDYMDAVSRGDTETAQKMVDESDCSLSQCAHWKRPFESQQEKTEGIAKPFPPFWSKCRDSNPRSLGPEPSAIPNFATPR